MNFREVRRRWTPQRFRTNARRRWRDKLLRRFGLQLCYSPPIVTQQPDILVRSVLPFIVAQQLLTNPQFTFLQIGAFDGVGDDDLRELIIAHQLRGVLVEPQPAAFARLRETYRDQPQLTFLQVAIAEREGVRELYCRRGKASMAASFDRGHLLRHGISSDEIVVQSVACHTVESAIRAGDLERVDLIQIDAEGYDWSIIRSIDFGRLRPAILRFEYRNMSKQDANFCLAHLAEHGYRFLIEARDIIAVEAATVANSTPMLSKTS